MTIPIIFLGSAAGNIVQYAQKNKRWQTMPKLWIDTKSTPDLEQCDCDFIAWDGNEALDLTSFTKGHSRVILVAGLSGSVGSTVNDLALQLVKQGINVRPIVIKPFAFEGQERHKITDGVIESMTQCLATLTVFDNELILKWLGNGKTLVDGFEECNRQVLEHIDALLGEGS
ncbi:hypothetical protein [Vibrio maerlii]|uniref:hypothetical protein n=1 Tax=Vibrio maerlii TaxID=2231648 RepID=UPI000E3D6C9F|nr:hypothetical protein [Vibrio maerlii]